MKIARTPGAALTEWWNAIAKGSLVGQLRRDHDVVVYRFDEADVPAQVAAFSKTTLAGTREIPGQDRRQAFARAFQASTADWPWRRELSS